MSLVWNPDASLPRLTAASGCRKCIRFLHFNLCCNLSRGLWQPMPVEYKHGRSKINDADRLQLCAQAMALEEMLVCEVPEGEIFYEETRQREHVSLTPELRSTAQTMADEMNRLFARGYTPKSKPGKHCNACSLKELCLPALYQQADPAAYLREHIEEGAP